MSDVQKVFRDGYDYTGITGTNLCQSGFKPEMELSAYNRHIYRTKIPMQVDHSVVDRGLGGGFLLGLKDS